MKTRFLKVTFVVAIAMIGAVNFFNAQKSEKLSDTVLVNVEALAQAESNDEFTKTTCCLAVLFESFCDGCDGKRHSFAVEING